MRAIGAFAEVATVFLDQEPDMRDVLALIVRHAAVVVVPLFVADGWHVGQTIPEDLALDGAETRRDGRRSLCARGGNSPERRRCDCRARGGGGVVT